MIAVLDDHRAAYGVEPICKVLRIAPSTYHARAAARADPAKGSTWSRRDGELCAQIRRVLRRTSASMGCARGALPRWIIGSRDAGHGQPTLVLEPGVPGADTLAAEAPALGLAVATTDGPHDDAGHVQLARLRGTTLSSASDPRADGIAAVL